MPRTGKGLNVGDVTELELNIHAGVEYVRFMMDQYFKDEPMDDLNKGRMTFAAYNAFRFRRGMGKNLGRQQGNVSRPVVAQSRFEQEQMLALDCSPEVLRTVGEFNERCPRLSGAKDVGS